MFADSRLIQTLTKYLRFARNHLRVHGLHYSVSLLGREIIFDLTHRVETITPKEVNEHSAPQGPHDCAFQYQGADPKLVNDLLEQLPHAARQTTFVDYGCGKGRVLILAAVHGFKKLVGVELLKDLASVCDENLQRIIKRFPGTICSVHQGDAALFELPKGELTVFFYNPFSGKVLDSVVSRLSQRADLAPQEVRVVYVNPMFLEVFEAHGFKVTYTMKHRGVPLGVLLQKQTS
jgi:predicted RNA methylase